jgi:hypothetical protein
MKNYEAYEEFLESVKAHDPVDDSSLRDWADSEAGRRVLSEIVARRDGESRRVARRSRRFRALALGAGALVAVIAIVVGVVMAVGEEPSSAPEITVERVAALDSVVTMAEALRGSASTEWAADVVGPARMLGAAESLGIITSAERELAATSDPVSRGTYALWVWRGLGSLLVPVREATLTDLGGLSTEMRAAVIGVVADGILDPRADGSFAAEELLTLEEELEARTRLGTALGLGPPEDVDGVSH